MHVGDIGASELARALKENQTLITLDMSRNKLSDDGACAIADMLMVNTSLKEVAIHGNHNVSSKSVDCFINCLRQNKTIQKLRLPYGLKERCYNIL